MFATIYKLQANDAPWRYAVKCDYNAELVDALKKNIPARQRKWCPDIKQWWFKEEVIDDVLGLLEHFCSNVHHSNGSAYGTGRPPGADVAAAYRTLYLTPDAPAEVIKAAYRALSKQYHPDAGGTTGAMQRLNEAFERLTKK